MAQQICPWYFEKQILVFVAKGMVLTRILISHCSHFCNHQVLLSKYLLWRGGNSVKSAWAPCLWKRKARDNVSYSQSTFWSVPEVQEESFICSRYEPSLWFHLSYEHWRDTEVSLSLTSQCQLLYEHTGRGGVCLRALAIVLLSFEFKAIGIYFKCASS